MGALLRTSRAMLCKPEDVSLLAPLHPPTPFPTSLLTVYTGLDQLALKKSQIERYIYLSNLRNANVHLFYRLVMDNLAARRIVNMHVNSLI